MSTAGGIPPDLFACTDEELLTYLETHTLEILDATDLHLTIRKEGEMFIVQDVSRQSNRLNGSYRSLAALLLNVLCFEIDWREKSCLPS